MHVKNHVRKCAIFKCRHLIIWQNGGDSRFTAQRRKFVSDLWINICSNFECLFLNSIFSCCLNALNNDSLVFCKYNWLIMILLLLFTLWNKYINFPNNYIIFINNSSRLYLSIVINFWIIIFWISLLFWYFHEFLI